MDKQILYDAELALLDDYYDDVEQFLHCYGMS